MKRNRLDGVGGQQQLSGLGNGIQRPFCLSVFTGETRDRLRLTVLRLGLTERSGFRDLDRSGVSEVWLIRGSTCTSLAAPSVSHGRTIGDASSVGVVVSGNTGTDAGTAGTGVELLFVGLFLSKVGRECFNEGLDCGREGCR